MEVVAMDQRLCLWHRNPAPANLTHISNQQPLFFLDDWAVDLGIHHRSGDELDPLPE